MKQIRITGMWADSKYSESWWEWVESSTSWWAMPRRGSVPIAGESRGPRVRCGPSGWAEARREWGRGLRARGASSRTRGRTCWTRAACWAQCAAPRSPPAARAGRARSGPRSCSQTAPSCSWTEAANTLRTMSTTARMAQFTLQRILVPRTKHLYLNYSFQLSFQLGFQLRRNMNSEFFYNAYAWEKVQ